MDQASSEKAVTRVPFKLVMISIIGLWATYWVIVSLRAELLGMEQLVDMSRPRILSILVSILITIGLWVVLRPFDAKPLWAKITAALLFALPAALLSAQANRVIFADTQAAVSDKMLVEFAERRGIDPNDGENEILASMSEFLTPSAQAQIIEIGFSRYFVLLAWCAFYLALLVGEKARVAERREQEFRSAAKAAELKSLRYQVNPHFLFNTLNSLSALVLTGKTQAAERMIQMLSTFYRRSLAEDTTADVPLREEIALQKLYLDIEAVRFPMRLVAQYDIPAELENALVPGMVLQPLIENSVKHAVAPSSGRVTISLSAREEYGRLVITVSDDGASAADRDDTRPGFGIGLGNVRQRLQARFGNEATVVSGHAERGFATHLRLPLRRMKERAAA
ncbi:sensor histidine kinase [Aurantiacibacter aquimixticola]|uniref:Sensor histidine kinase n=1 Tax=Aurantiacibacter aquimixticola TaxID=1958945 RepID=A0A419RUU6_9SPHN|nr:histidine kinase [Aurantiacibacter aquimixticola]RJY09555.1 sensor histidine kinase [Aurantiacibacter aquimixticola]